MSIQKYLKKIENNLPDSFLIGIGPGLEGKLVSKVAENLGINFKTVFIDFNGSFYLKSDERLTLDISIDDVFNFYPSSPYFAYLTIVRRKLIELSKKENKPLVFPLSLEELFYLLMKFFLSGNIRKFHLLRDEIVWNGVRIVNPVFGIRREKLFEIADEIDAKYEFSIKDEEYQKFSKIVEVIDKINPDILETFMKGKLKRIWKVIDDERVICSRCGFESYSKICDFCRIYEKIMEGKRKAEKPKFEPKIRRRWRIYR